MSSKDRSEKSERRLKYTSARKMAEEKGSGFTAPYLKLPEKVQRFKPKKGVYLLDIMPYEAGEGNPWAEEGQLHFERTFYVHRAVGANEDMYICPKMTAKQPCPICEFRAKLMRDNEDEATIQALSPKQRQLFNVIDTKEPEKGVQVMDMSYHNFGKLLEATIRDADEEDPEERGWEKFYYLDDGLTVKIGFGEATGGSYKYLEAETISFRRRREPYEEDMLDEVHNLDDMLIIEDYDKLKEIFLQTAKSKKKEEPEETDEDNPPKRRRSTEDDEEPASKRRSLDAEEEEPEEKPKRKSRDDDEWEEAPKSKRRSDDEEEEKPRVKSRRDEEEEEPAPKRRAKDDDDEPPRKSSKSKADEDDEWNEFDKTADDEPAEDEEEAEKPKRRRDDDDEPAPKRRSRDEEEEPAPKRKRRD